MACAPYAAGTTFPVDPVDPAQPSNVASAPAEVPSDPASILVVDDDAAIRLVITRVLRRKGHQVEEARDGREALSMLASQSFDIVFLDLVMPGMDGTTTGAAIRTLHPAARIVYVSGIVPTTLPEGAAFVPKPFTTQSILDAVRLAN
jgi:two-component system cell cycle sensor histidine kinase/response regulator CckA